MRPILIVSLPRSGSSMVAGAFALHGVWFGTCTEADAHNPKGYFENVALNTLIGDTYGHSVAAGGVPDPVDGWPHRVYEAIRADGYSIGPWGYKCSAVYWRLFEAFDPYWITIRRSLSSILASGDASGRYRPQPRSVDVHLAIMKHLEKERGAARVCADDVVRGDLTTLEAAFRHAGLTMDEAKVREWIDPALWRHGGKAK